MLFIGLVALQTDKYLSARGRGIKVSKRVRWDIDEDVIRERDFGRAGIRAPRFRGVDDLIQLVGAVDELLRAQAESAASYFLEDSRSSIYEEHEERLRHGILKAYRWQYILSGVELRKFRLVLQQMLTLDQHQRITLARH